MTRTASPPWPGDPETVKPDDARIAKRNAARKKLEAFRRWLVSLPDRGTAARPDDVPPEFYRFPGF